MRAERARRGMSGAMYKNTKDVLVSEATKEELEAEITALRKQNGTLATERDTLCKATKFSATEMSSLRTTFATEA